MIHDRVEHLGIYLPKQYKGEIEGLFLRIHPNSKEGFKKINKNIDLEILSYTTEILNRKRIESCDECVEIHFILLGTEKCSVFSRNDIEGTIKNNRDDMLPQMQITNSPGEFTMIFPHEICYSALSPGANCLVVKKGIIKIR